MIIDTEFQALIPALAPEEVAQLEANIVAHGCRDPLTVWGDVLLDGHHRYAICTRLDLPFSVVSVDLPDREAAMDWIDANQLGRRNLTPDAFRLLLGRRYNRVKKAAHDGGAGLQRSGAQSEPHLRTADRLAEQHGVSRETVKRAGQFAEEVERTPALRAAIAENRPVLHVRREMKQREMAERKEAAHAVPLPPEQHRCIVIDPPWEMQKIEREVRPNQMGFDYPTMTEAELSAFRVADLAAEDCHLFCWTTHKHLPLAMQLLGVWGFRYVCTMVWHKPGGFQPIGLPQYNCEFVLYARRGAPSFRETKAFPCCFEAPRREHSRKPDEFYEVIRRVTDGPRIDVFSREQREGFAQFGDEPERFIA